MDVCMCGRSTCKIEFAARSDARGHRSPAPRTMCGVASAGAGRRELQWAVDKETRRNHTGSDSENETQTNRKTRPNLLLSWGVVLPTTCRHEQGGIPIWQGTAHTHFFAPHVSNGSVGRTMVESFHRWRCGDSMLCIVWIDGWVSLRGRWMPASTTYASR
jgi:hypothetical protein